MAKRIIMTIAKSPLCFYYIKNFNMGRKYTNGNKRLVDGLK